jgi:Icc protein
MLIAQLTDLHIVAPAGSRLLDIDTAERSRLAVEHLNGLRPQPDVVLVTGDLVNEGTAQEYALARPILDQLAMPYFVIPGNHDRGEALLEAFADHPYLPGAGSLGVQYAVDDWPVRLVGLDTSLDGEPFGGLSDERLAWLDQTLATEPDQPTLIFMHHPPIRTGIGWIDAAGLYGSARLREILARHPQVERLVCGHAHRQVHARWAGTTVSIAPSSSYLQVALALADQDGFKFGLASEPWALSLFLWDQSCGLISHASLVDGHPAIIPAGVEKQSARFRDLHAEICRREFPGFFLREVVPTDLPVFFANQQNPEAAHMAAFTAKDPHDRAAFDAHWQKILADPTIIIRTIVAGGRVAGSVLTYETEGQPEVSYWLGRDFWGQGLATRAVKEFLQGVDSRRPMLARVASDNASSIRVLEKTGFQVTGQTRGFANARGQEIDELVMELD